MYCSFVYWLYSAFAITIYFSLYTRFYPLYALVSYYYIFVSRYMYTCSRCWFKTPTRESVRSLRSSKRHLFRIRQKFFFFVRSSSIRIVIFFTLVWIPILRWLKFTYYIPHYMLYNIISYIVWQFCSLVHNWIASKT